MIQLNIKQILQNKDKTAYWLAKKTGISPNNIGKICNGETKNIRLDTMEKLCKALECEIEDLFLFTKDDTK